MVSMSALCAYFVLAFFSGCPTGGMASSLQQEDVQIFIKNRRPLYLFTIRRE